MVDHNLKLTRDVPVLVRPESVGFVASFAEASVAASGTTIAEAIENLKDLLADHFHRLNEIPAEKLGPLPRRQLAMLRQFFE